LLDPLDDDDDEPELDPLELLDPPELDDDVELVLELEALDEDEDEAALLELDADEEDDPLPPVNPEEELLVGLVGEPAQAAMKPAAPTAATPDRSSRNARLLLRCPSSASSIGVRAVSSSICVLMNAPFHVGDGRRLLTIGEITNGSAVEIQLDASDDVVGRNHVHAPGQPADDVHAQRLRAIFLIAVAERHRARAPAAAVVAAAERSHGVDELVMGVGGEMRRFTAAGDDHARTIAWRARPRVDRSRQVHEQADRADHSLCVVDEPNELPKIGLAA
jgi:hypothetical protein